LYFWKTSALIQDLAESRVSQREKMKYLLAYVFLSSAALGLGDERGYDWPFSRYVEYAGLVVISLVGTYVCYRSNQKGDQLDFIDRFICLSLPVSVRFAVILIPSYFLLFAVRVWFRGPGDPPRAWEDWAKSIFVIAFCGVYYVWLQARIGEISIRKALAASPPTTM